MRKSEKCGHAILIAVCSLISVSCLADDPLKIPFQSFSPLNLDDGWEIAKPDEVGIDEEALKDVYRYIHKDDAIWQIRSLLVIRNGKLVAESYMKNSNDRTNLHAIWSNTKQVVGILAGIAVDRGLISLNDTIADHLPEVSKHPEKSQITIENLLMMKSGVNYDNDGYKGQDAVLSREEPSNSIDYVLGLGMHSSPGAQFRYKNSDPHILSAIIQERAGKTLRDWAQDVLFDEIGIRRLTWLVYKDSVTMGGYGIKTTPREMGKIGQLVLNDGMWEGKQIVSSSWINEMTSSKVPAHETQNANITFGYLWWKDTERNVNFMWGHGGQFVLTNKDKNIVVVITAEQHTSGDFNLSAYEAFSLYDRINSITK